MQEQESLKPGSAGTRNVEPPVLAVARSETAGLAAELVRDGFRRRSAARRVVTQPWLVSLAGHALGLGVVAGVAVRGLPPMEPPAILVALQAASAVRLDDRRLERKPELTRAEEAAEPASLPEVPETPIAEVDMPAESYGARPDGIAAYGGTVPVTTRVQGGGRKWAPPAAGPAPARRAPRPPAATPPRAGPPAAPAPTAPSVAARDPLPTYPKRARRLGQEGTVVLEAAVDTEGRATRVDVKHSSGFDRLDQAAVDAVRAWSFHPARLGERAVPGVMEVVVTFRLE